MRKPPKSNPKEEPKAYLPPQDSKVYVYRRRCKKLFNEIPYVFKMNIDYLKQLT